MTDPTYKINYPQTPFLDETTKMPTLAWQLWLQNPSVSSISVGGSSSGGSYVGVAITGSTVDSSPIGSTTPSTGVFTSLSASALNSTGIMTLAYNYQNASNGGSYSFGQNSVLILNSSTPLSSVTISLPAGALSGQIVMVCTNQPITSVTLNPAPGQSVNNPIGSLAGDQGAAYIYTSTTAWFRLY